MGVGPLKRVGVAVATEVRRQRLRTLGWLTLGIAATVAGAFFWGQQRRAIGQSRLASQCRSWYSRASTAAESALVDARGGVNQYDQQGTCGELRRLGIVTADSNPGQSPPN